MEKFERRSYEPKPLDWRAHTNEGKFTTIQQDQLDTIAELALSEKIDFEKQASEYESKEAGDGRHHKADFVDLLMMWGYTKGAITAEEYRSLQRSNS